MTAPLLALQGVGKSFRRYRREIHRVLSWFGLPMPPADERWVLRDIGFAVHPGEAVGIVGRNGAGKSTLLKMIAGIMRPSEGSITVSGRIAAILELGMGFSGELTGR
ncbi:MAG TPA: ATP-binding cassette domain-containing protein, partial [Tianweitania sediminis]|nr:ATP-binding cassette domain-containing protein [Tianweitania sediminis]